MGRRTVQLKLSLDAWMSTFWCMSDRFRRFAQTAADSVGGAWAFALAMTVVLVWACTGPLFGFSDTWQLVINTGTTVVTFLMVFLIQNTQNRDARALHLKLDELIRSNRKARNVFADLEEATDDELRQFQAEFKRLRQRGIHESEAAERAAARLRKDENAH
jgi:low affinity Fe/Cu permease